MGSRTRMFFRTRRPFGIQSTISVASQKARRSFSLCLSPTRLAGAAETPQPGQPVLHGSGQNNPDNEYHAKVATYTGDIGDLAPSPYDYQIGFEDILKNGIEPIPIGITTMWCSPRPACHTRCRSHCPCCCSVPGCLVSVPWRSAARSSIGRGVEKRVPIGGHLRAAFSRSQ